HRHLHSFPTRRSSDLGSGRPYDFEPPAHQLTQRVLASPRLRPIARWHAERWLRERAREGRFEHWHALGRHPQAGLPQQRRSAFRSEEHTSELQSLAYL